MQTTPSPLCQISCANYEARALGIRADMRIAEAKALCPDIVVVPYLFEKYQVRRNGEARRAPLLPSSCQENFWPPHPS